MGNKPRSKCGPGTRALEDYNDRSGGLDLLFSGTGSRDQGTPSGGDLLLRLIIPGATDFLLLEFLIPASGCGEKFAAETVAPI